MTAVIHVEVEDRSWSDALPDVEAIVRTAAVAALDGGAGEVTVLLADDETVRELNARFRSKDQPTNVLSFPAATSARPHLGDLALAFGVCAREAEAQGKPLAHHLTHLTVHGVLHLLGWDHIADAEADEMEGTERAILATLGVPDPYAPSAAAEANV